MNYQTIDPAIDLKAFVKCHWTLDALAQRVPEKQRIVPDGCMELIFHYGDQYQQYDQSGQSIIQPKCFLFGQITEPLNIAPTGLTGVFATRFHPDGFIPFSKVTISELNNRAVPLKELFEELEVAEIEQLVLSAADNEERLNLVESFLRAKIKEPASIDRLAKSSVDLILELKGQVSIDELSKQLSTQRRQLERKCALAIGLSPKQFSKIVRLQATLKLLSKPGVINLTALALEGGYYDQAHFIKDFKEFTGVSPKHFYADNLKISSLFAGEG
jgi:AraC-like DNA-binding protein